MHIFFSLDNSGMDYSRPHPVTGATLPQILGLEFSGEVVELGEGATDLQVDDRVAVWLLSRQYCSRVHHGRRSRRRKD